MICVSIGRGRHKFIIAEHRHLAEQGAKLVELRLDYISGAVNIKRLLADRPCAVVVSCRRPADGGKWQGAEEQRMLLLRSAIAEGVEYIDLEDDVAASVHADLARGNVDLSDHRLRRKMSEEMAAAVASIRAGK